MSWERPFLVLAAANNVAWAGLIAFAPERVCCVTPPLRGLIAVLIVAVGGCFAVNAIRRVPVLLGVGLLSKALGPLVGLVAVSAGYLESSSWPVIIVTDLMWIPPLVVLARRRQSW